MSMDVERQMPNTRKVFLLISAMLLTTHAGATAPTGEISFSYRHHWESLPNLPSNQTDMAVIPRFVIDGPYETTWIIEPALRARSDAADTIEFDPYKTQLRTYTDNFDITAGYDVVFWGATEGAQILDILNQRDLGADFDGDVKLGQPLLSLTSSLGDGLATFYYLPYTPKRRFRDNSERLTAGFDINENSAQWLDHQDAYYPGFAGRYALTASSMDIALIGFHGVNRSPAFIPQAGQFSPVYSVATQVGVDVQWVSEDLLTKLEVLNVSDAPTIYGRFDTATQWVISAEYSFYSVFDTIADIRMIAEYSDNSLGDRLLSLYQHDVLMAIHTSFNDVDSTSLSVSWLHDLDSYSNLIDISLTHRLNDNIELEASLYELSSMASRDFFFGLEPDSFGEITLTYYF
ncbi:hypothetical protein LRP50_13865 [Enterovibrio sp. ZSDZ42]|uniref:Uncharacterized protein n=1 Tax=Enterovibrio gelatinilyticus TaxID=2899819 RepID=A0ABT5R1S7_9GAMM|nr:hypothetical protein [Enterovibrio sp. ZSDZ42]MDD1794223.1 hypothetical protein [Enterovibrio sp. ZSDZ42]